MKPGYRTSEFYLTALTYLISLAYMSGLISDGSQADKIVGLAVMALGHLGYSISRGLAKGKTETVS